MEVTPSTTEPAGPLDGLANYASSPLHQELQEPEETLMVVDQKLEEVEKAEEVLSPPQISSPQGGDETKSEDILVAEPAEVPLGTPSPLSQKQVVDDDDLDELDIIGSLSPSRSASETSVEPRTQATTQEPSRADSEIIDIIASPGESSRPLFACAEATHDDVAMASGEPEEKESVVDEAPEVIFNQASPERVATPELMHPEAESHLAISDPLTVLQQPLVRSVAVEVPHRQTPLYIPAPSSPIHGLPEYNFDGEPESEPKTTSPRHSVSPKQQRHHFNPIYNLPPLKALPVEFNRKLKSAKGQRRREKERERGLERGDSKREYKDDGLPMGINKWGATVRANPVYKKVSRATKCLSTREWNVCSCLCYDFLTC